jgi:hypothetical protein
MSPQISIRDQEDENASEVVSTADIQGWLCSIDKCLNEICMVFCDGKINPDQKLRVTNLCSSIGRSTEQMAVKYQSLKQKALSNYSTLPSLKEDQKIKQALKNIKQSVESCTKPSGYSKKEPENSYVRLNPISSVSIFPADSSKSSDDTKNLVQKIISPEEMKLSDRGFRKLRTEGW